ncbi:MAG: hypothetical protein U0L65_00535 [Bacteroidales bacterium]|nr:hypothetical protein [Bacteroidales bacterium]
MEKNKIVCLLLFALIITSCSSTRYYQVYNIESENTIKNDNNFLYSNEDCELKYDFWGERGDLFFIFTNKTNTDICIDLKRSSFIQNDFAYNYYDQEIITLNTISSTNTTILSSTTTLYKTKYTTLGSETQNTTSSISKKNASEIWVPANSSKTIFGFNLSSYIYFDCEDESFTLPKKQSEIKKYTKDNTPLTFRNRIVYHFVKDKEDKIIDNEFWISHLSNYTKKEFIDNIYYYNCFDIVGEIECIDDFKFKRFDRFYNVYELKDLPKERKE